MTNVKSPLLQAALALLAALFCFLPLRAERYDIEEGLFRWTLYDRSQVTDLEPGLLPYEATLKGFTTENLDHLTELVIPSTVSYEGQEYVVTIISNDKELRNQTITKLTLPNQLRSTCGQLLFFLAVKDVNIPESLIDYANDIFRHSPVEKPLYNSHIFIKVGSAAEGSYAIPDGIEKMANYALSGSRITELIVPSSINCVPELGAMESSPLERLILSEGVTIVGDRACQFYVTSLKYVQLPSTLVSIGEHAFDGCTLLNVSSFPDGLEKIGSFAFYGCLSLGDISLPPTLKEWRNAFNSSGITKVEIAEGCKTIPRQAFYECKNLVSVTLPESLETIEGNAFSDCDALGYILIPKNVSEIAATKYGSYSDTTKEGAFYNCDNLIFDVAVDNPNFEVIENAIWSIGDRLELIEISGASTSLTIPVNAGVFPEIDLGNFENLWKWTSKITSVTINLPTNFLFDYYPSYSRKSLFVIFPNGEMQDRITCLTLNGLNKYDLYDTWTLPKETKSGKVHSDNVTELGIGGDTFINGYYRGSNILSPISDFFPNVETMRITAFEAEASVLTGMAKLKHLISDMCGPGTAVTGANLGAFFKEGSPSDSQFKAVLQVWEDGSNHTYSVPVSLETVTLNEGVETIPFGCFYNMSMLSELHLPASLYMVSEKAFYGCAGLKHLYVDAAEPPVAFSNSFDGMRLTSCVLHVPAGCTAIYKEAEGWKRFNHIEEDADISVTVSKNIENAGVVYGISQFNLGDTARLEAAANRGYSFIGWHEGGTCVWGKGVYEFKVDRTRQLTAVFAPTPNINDVKVEPTDENVTLTFSTVEGATVYIVNMYGGDGTAPLSTVTIDAASTRGAYMNAPAQDLSATFAIEWQPENGMIYSFYRYEISAFNGSETLDRFIGVFNRAGTDVETLIVDEAETTVTVISLQGIVLMRDAPASRLSELKSGLYIVNGKKRVL